MAASPIDPARITDYHMHVYYDPDSRDRAAQLRAWVEERFPVRMGRWHDVPVGPHPTAMYQIQFTPELFPDAGAVRDDEPHGADGAAASGIRPPAG